MRLAFKAGYFDRTSPSTFEQRCATIEEPRKPARRRRQPRLRTGQSLARYTYAIVEFLEYAAPFVLFAAFLGFFYWRARRDGRLGPRSRIARSEPRPGLRISVSDWPPGSRLYLVFRVGLYIPIALFIVAVVGSEATGADTWFGLLVPAGAMIISYSLALLTNYRGFRDRLAAEETDTFSYRLTGRGSADRFGGVLAMIVGIGWLAIGAWQLIEGI